MGGRLASVVVATVALAGCLESDAQRCASGRICPVGSACDDVNDTCVSDDQVEACDGQPDGMPCEFGGADGLCEGGICVPDTCGDLRVTGSEDCEPELTLTEDCMTLGYYEPDGLACGDDCRFDVTDCVGECGDDERNGPEPCEGDDLGGVDCEAFGYYEPDGIVCNPASCTFDLTGCSGECGDLVVDISEGEACDGPPPAGTCVEFGFDAGALRCSPFCTPGFAACGRVGWHHELTGPLNISNLAVWASSLDDIYLVGSLGTIMHGHSGEWTNENVSNTLYGVFGFGDDVFAVGTSGQIVRRDPATGVWNTIVTGGFDDLFDVWGAEAADLWAVGESIVHFDGTAWNNQGVPGGGGTLQGLHGSSAADIWAVGDGGTIVYWDGSTWTRVASPTSERLEDVWTSGPADAWAIGSEILRWDGATWAVHADVPGGDVLVAIWGAHRDDITAISTSGLVAHWDGATWSFETVQSGNDLFGVDGVLMVASAPGVAFREATTWTEPPGPVPAFDRAWVAASDDVWAVGFDGSLHHWDGRTWIQEPIAAIFRDVWGFASDEVWAVGDNGALWHFDGVDWTSHPDAGVEDVSSVWGSGPDDVWAFGTDGSFLRWTGSAWTEYDQGTPSSFNFVWGSGPDDIWILGGFGNLRHWDGSSWVSNEEPLVYAFFGGLWGSGPDDLWAISGDGVAFHYDGTTWSEGFQLNIEVSALWGSAPDDVLAVGNLGRAMHYDGTSWAPIRPQVEFYPWRIWGDRAELVVAGERGPTGVLTRLARHTRWSCRGREVACGDAIDDDCDQRVDGDDEDCLGGIAISEVHGGAEDFVELRNRTGATASLAGLFVEWGHGCSSGSHRIGATAIVRDGDAYRVTADRSPGAREGWNGDLCDTPDAGGWVMLCAGECDRVACTNVLDFVAKTGTSAPAGTPVCAGMIPGPVSVTGATATESLTRTAFTGSGAKGVAADWAVGAMTRD